MKTEFVKQWVPIQKEDLQTISSDTAYVSGEQEIPNRQMETWRFTDINRLKRLIAQEKISDSSTFVFDTHCLPEVQEDTHRIILTDNITSVTTLDLPESIEQLGWEEVQNNLNAILIATGCKYHWPVVINDLHMNYCIALKVKQNTRGNLEIVHPPTNLNLQAMRILLVVEEGAHLSLNQVILGQGLHLSSVVIEVLAKQGSKVTHGILGFADGDAGFLGHIAVCQESASTYSFTSVLRGWGIARLEPRFTQSSGYANTMIKGLQVVEDNNQIDTHSYISFEGPEGELDQLNKSIADDKGHSIFNGIVRVPCLAQRTKASQLSRNLLLSSQARIDTKPELEIVADDVRCTHGATISKMQEEEIFYLQSRGLNFTQASQLVKKGYYQDILNSLPASSNAWAPLERIMQADSPVRVSSKD